MSAEIIDLGIVRATSTEPDVRFSLVLWVGEDGEIVWRSETEEREVEGRDLYCEGLVKQALREWLTSR